MEPVLVFVILLSIFVLTLAPIRAPSWTLLFTPRTLPDVLMHKYPQENDKTPCSSSFLFPSFLLSTATAKSGGD